MGLDDILIKIRTQFEGKGAAEASKSLDSLDQSSRRASPTLDKTADSLGKVNKSTRVSVEEFTRAARSASVLTGSMEGLGALVSQVATRFTALASALPVIGLLIAAFTAWKAAINAVIESQKAAAASLRDIKSQNFANGVNSMAEAYARLDKSIASANAKQKIFLEGQDAMEEAQHQLALASLAADKQAALSKETDPLKRALISAQFEEQLTGLNAGRARQKDARKLEALDATVVSASEERRAREDSIREMQARYSQGSKAGAELMAAQRTAMDAAWTPRGRESAGKEYQDEINKNTESQKQLAEQIKKAQDDANSAALTEENARNLINAQLIQTQATKKFSGVSIADSASGTTAATTAVSMADLAAQKSAAEAQLPQYQQQAAAAQDYLSTIPDRISSGTYSQADQSAMLQALTSAQEQTALLQSFITRIGAEMSKQNEILRTLPSSH
jgi:hypothetical protein